MAFSVVNDDNDIDLTSDVSSYWDSALSKKALCVSPSWPTGDEDEDEAAKKIYACLQWSVDSRSNAYRRFQRTPASKLPISFVIDAKIISTTHAVQTAPSPLLALPQELLFIIVPLLDDTDAACLACTCKHLAAISQNFAITNTREYFIRRGHLSPDIDMCSGCHKNRPTTPKFWYREVHIIKEWLDPFVGEEEDDKYEYLDVIEQGIRGWTAPLTEETYGSREWLRRVVFGDAPDDAEDQATESRKVASRKRAFVKCPTCCAQDVYELILLDLLLHECEVGDAMNEKVTELAEKAQDLVQDGHDETDGDGAEVSTSADGSESLVD